MTPVKNVVGDYVNFSTTPLNKFGYDVELDKNGQFEKITIDYEALAAQ